MESRVKFLGHSAHQQVIVFPLGLLGTSVIFDLIHLLSGHEGLAVAAFWMILAGVLGGLVAAPLGFIEWLHIKPGTRAKRVGALHGLLNVTVTLLFAISWYLRLGEPLAPGALAYLLVFIALALAGTAAWMGGELVSRLGVGVYDDAHVDATSSLSLPDHDGM